MDGRNILAGDRPLIWPYPNECAWGEGFLQLRPQIDIHCSREFAEEAELFASFLESRGLEPSWQESGAILEICRWDGGEIGGEGYTLNVTQESILIRASTGKGAFYGLQTLTQLMLNSPGLRIPAVSIVDMPFKPVRGVHIYVPPRENVAWFKRYVDFLARYKFNIMYMEIGAAVKFDSHPEINEAWEKFCAEMMSYPCGPDDNGDGTGMQSTIGHAKDSTHIENGGGSYLQKKEFAELVEYIKRRHIEIVPEVQALSHTYWMLLSHPECAERNDDPYPDTWCPSNPRTYEIYFECLEEVIDLIKPTMVHIGHDEYYSIGRCGFCRQRTGHDILAEDIIKIHGWLKNKGIRTVMWGDKLLEFFGHLHQ